MRRCYVFNYGNHPDYPYARGLGSSIPGAPGYGESTQSINKSVTCMSKKVVEAIIIAKSI